MCFIEDIFMKPICKSYRLINGLLMQLKHVQKPFQHMLRAWEKSMLFTSTFLQLVGPDYPLSILPYVDGREFLECAF